MVIASCLSIGGVLILGGLARRGQNFRVFPSLERCVPEEIRPSPAVGRKTSDEPAVSWVCNGYRNETTPGVCDREAYRVMDAKFVCFALIPRSRLDDCFWVYRIIFPGEFARLLNDLLYRA